MVFRTLFAMAGVSDPFPQKLGLACRLIQISILIRNKISTYLHRIALVAAAVMQAVMLFEIPIWHLV